MTSETDAEFVERIKREWDGDNVPCVEDFDQLIALARRGAEAAARIEQLEAALKPLCCTCDRAASDECSRSEVNCPFWNARAALGEEHT